jgi:hypothetical protein
MELLSAVQRSYVLLVLAAIEVEDWLRIERSELAMAEISPQGTQ